jgi:fatty aldehyde-generating acyl-ACP reductase
MSWGYQDKPWFAFLIHMRERTDVDRWKGAAALSRYASSKEDFYERALGLPPFVGSSVSIRNSPVLGDIIVIPRPAEVIMVTEGRELIAWSLEIAAQRGALVVGLGGLTAPATRGGSWLLDKAPPGLTVTNGNSLTAAMVRENVAEAREFLDIERPTVAVLGSTGSVGAAVTELLADEGLPLILIGRSAAKARAAAPQLSGPVEFSGDMTDMGRADVVVVLTSGSASQVKPEHFREERPRVVLDVAAPPNVEPDDRPKFLGRGAHVVQGGWVLVPRIVTSADPSLVLDPDAIPDSAPACLAETYLLAREGIRESFVGNATAVNARRIASIAAARGVRARPLALPERQLAAQPEAAA